MEHSRIPGAVWVSFRLADTNKRALTARPSNKIESQDYFRIADNHKLVKADPAAEVLKARVIAYGVKVGMHFEELQDV